MSLPNDYRLLESHEWHQKNADGTITLDFNRAVLPPCAFSYAFNCPMPPKQNRFPVPIQAGEKVRGLGAVVSAPVGEGLLGRVVDPLGRPLDDRGPVASLRRDPIERAAPGIVERDLVTEPLQTGIKVVDGLFALGAGHFRIVLLQLQLAVDAGGHALAGQLTRLAGALQFGLRQILLGVCIAELHIGACHVAGQFDARRTCLDIGGACLAQCGLPRGTLAAPQVEAPVEAGIAVLGGGEMRLWAEQAIGQARAGNTGAAVDGRATRSVGDADFRLRLTCTRIGDRQAGVVLECFADQVRELRITEPAPPVLCRPCGG